MVSKSRYCLFLFEENIFDGNFCVNGGEGEGYERSVCLAGFQTYLALAYQVITECL